MADEYPPAHPSTEPFPTVGTVVHYWPRPSFWRSPSFWRRRILSRPVEPEILPAIVVKVFGSAKLVAVYVFDPRGIFLDAPIPFSATPKPGHWSWPPRIG
jgi:hypothetical protein